MARTQYTVTFPAAKAGDEVTWPNTVKIYPDASTSRPLGNGYIEVAAGSFTGWSDAASVTFTRAGTSDSVTVTTGSPTGTGAAVPTAASGAPGAPVVRAFPFAFDTPDLATGAAVYTPTPGDILLDGWLEISEVFDGTTPIFDFGQFPGTQGYIAFMTTFAGLGLSVLGADNVIDYAGFAFGKSWSGPLSSFQSFIMPSSTYDSLVTVASPNLNMKANALSPGGGNRLMPVKFTTADPIKVLVSSDGTTTGGAPGSTTGAAILYLVTATPTPNP